MLWLGQPWQIIRQAEQGRVQPCMTPSMLEELSAVLSEPRLEARLRQMDLTMGDALSFVAQITEFFDDPVPLPSPIVTADPDDDVFILCAIEANAGTVVSGDRHLLLLGTYRSVRIVSAREFLELNSEAQ